MQPQQENKMLAQLDRQFLQADAAQVRALLAQCTPEEDPIEHFQYSQRLKTLEQQIADIGDKLSSQPASVALFFAGRPVIGSQGIRAAFGTKAIQQLQKLVSQRFAAEEQGPLASRGRVPLAEETQLLVTDVVRGSFGFVLQSTNEQVGSDVPLKTVIDEVAKTLSRMAAPDDALFEEASAEVDDRQLGTLREFFKLLDDEGASLRLVEGDRDFELDRSAVARARSRVEGLTITDRVDEVAGQIVGWTQYSHRFELMPHDKGSIVMGAVSREAMDRAVQDGLNPLHRHFRLSLKVREVRARNRQPRLTYSLQGMESAQAPSSWPTETQRST
jgi:hypothetical protein